MKFEYDAFVQALHKQFKEHFTVQQILELLNLSDEFGKDTPLSTGKRLKINHIAFSGKKVTEEVLEYSGQDISYSQEIQPGLNIWIADNLKGKSSVFKIIKYALTGSNDLKPNISKWLQHILVVFSINDKKYSIYLNTEKRSPKGTLYNKAILNFPIGDEFLEDQLFQASTKENLQDQLEDFFFRQFSYYSLKWTQRPSQKDNDGLLEVGTSWKTYFKSIFLESRDSNALMFGDQGKKVFQMLLGLYLTYPINKLTVERDKLLHTKGRQQSYNERQSKEQTAKKDELDLQLTQISSKLQELTALERQKVETSVLVIEYKNIMSELNIENDKILQVTNQLQASRQEKSRIESKRMFLEGEIKRLSKELQKATRQAIDIEEYLEIGIFFSNLDLKHCPSCNHTITKDKKHHAATGHTCALCTDDISLDEQEVDTESLKQKVESLDQLKDGLTQQIEKLKADLDIENKLFEVAYNNMIRLDLQKMVQKDTKAMVDELQKIEKSLNAEREKVIPNDDERNQLVAQKAVLEFQIKQLEEKPNGAIDTSIEQKISLFNSAIRELTNQRFLISEKILKRLSELMLSESQALGLKISEIVINDKFDILYKQDGDYLTFEDIAEGEQLRAKLAFYLSLIQLDIEYNFGRHTRFLIIDSPGKEEGDKKYLQGLTTVLRGIESRFGTNLQILIGTAERSLQDTLNHQFVSPDNTYVF